MPIIGVSITKQAQFRLEPQPFSNVYYYDGPTPDEAQAEQLVNGMRGDEGAVHSTEVFYIEGRVWTAGGTPAENDMIYVGALSGSGDATPLDNVDRERAFLVQWPAGQDSLGRAVYLRKWYHVCGLIGSTAPNPLVLGNLAQIDQATRDFVAQVANTLRQRDETQGTYNLVAATGRTTQGDGVCYPWFEHHQLGDEWR